MEMPRPDKPNWPTMHVIMMFITNAVELVLPTSINFTCPDASRWQAYFNYLSAKFLCEDSIIKMH